MWFKLFTSMFRLPIPRQPCRERIGTEPPADDSPSPGLSRHSVLATAEGEGRGEGELCPQSQRYGSSPQQRRSTLPLQFPTIHARTPPPAFSRPGARLWGVEGPSRSSNDE